MLSSCELRAAHFLPLRILPRNILQPYPSRFTFSLDLEFTKSMARFQAGEESLLTCLGSVTGQPAESPLGFHSGYYGFHSAQLIKFSHVYRTCHYFITHLF